MTPERGLLDPRAILTIHRRQFLGAGLGAGALLATGSLLSSRRAHATPFGEFPTGGSATRLPEGRRAKRVLEIFLYGGLSPWETLYFVEEYGRPTDSQFPNSQYYALDGAGATSIDAALASCSFPGGEPLGEFFAIDALGADVKLGPFAYRLRQRPDLVSRMRLLVQKHALEPHEGAVPQALTGKPVGQPVAAGLGAHIQRYFGERASAGRAAPFGYVFATGGLAGDNVSAAAATGLHPGMARPLMIKIDNAARFAELLSRGEVGAATDRQRYDALMNAYVSQYRDRLRFGGAGEPVRSPRFTDLSLAVESVGGVDAIAGVIDSSLFANRAGSSCGRSRSTDIPGMSLQAARHLLTHPTDPASYVCVSDVGLYEASGGGGYDTHTDNAEDTARNFGNLLSHLDSIVNIPGENDPNKLDLDDTLIILNTEFGRTPWRQDDGSGRNHHPYGYVTAFIGGPITAAEKGVYGAIGPDGLASSYITPSENRIGALLAMGIWPFAPEGFAVSDVRGATTEVEAATMALAHTLGVTP